MFHKWVSALIVPVAVLAVSCSSADQAPSSSTASASRSASTTTASGSTSAQPTSTAASSAAGTLDAEGCVAVTGANLDLATATNSEQARKPADVLAKYNPPPEVTEAVDHFVQTGGAQFDDPDFEKYNSILENWIKQVCPM